MVAKWWQRPKRDEPGRCPMTGLLGGLFAGYFAAMPLTVTLGRVLARRRVSLEHNTREV